MLGTQEASVLVLVQLGLRMLHDEKQLDSLVPESPNAALNLKPVPLQWLLLCDGGRYHNSMVLA